MDFESSTNIKGFENKNFSTELKTDHLAKSYILKSSPKFTCYTTNTVSDVYLFSLVSTQFTYFPQDVSETHTSLHSTELQLILRYDTDN